MKKGFTLIELLAVIVILAIIALIATPIVLDIIDSAKKSSVEATMKNIEKAALLEYSDLVLDGKEKDEIIYNCYDGKCTYNGKALSVKGDMPDRGRIIVNEDGATFENIIIKGYNCIKENSKFTCNNTGLTKVNGTSILIDNNKTTEIENYRIYGNSIQNGEPTPDTPVDIESVGDLVTLDNCSSYGSDACNNVGKYVIPIKVTGKNLFDKDSKNYDVFINTGTISSVSNYKTIFVNVENIDKLTLSVTKDIGNWYYALCDSIEVGSKIYDYNYISSKQKVTTNNHKYLAISLYYTNVSNFEFIQIEYGDKATEYEPYKETITNIYLDSPLRSIGEYSDYIDFKTGKVVRNIYKANFSQNLDLNENGSKWQREGYTTWNSTWFSEDTVNDSIHLQNVLSNRFKGGKWEWYGGVSPYNYVGYRSIRVAYFIISNEYTSITLDDDIETKKSKISEWFKNNETYLYFPLATPIEEEIDLPELSINKDTSVISVNTSITPSNIELEYYR